MRPRILLSLCLSTALLASAGTTATPAMAQEDIKADPDFADLDAVATWLADIGALQALRETVDGFEMDLCYTLVSDLDGHFPSADRQIIQSGMPSATSGADGHVCQTVDPNRPFKVQGNKTRWVKIKADYVDNIEVGTSAEVLGMPVLYVTPKFDHTQPDLTFRQQKKEGKIIQARVKLGYHRFGSPIPRARVIERTCHPWRTREGACYQDLRNARWELVLPEGVGKKSPDAKLIVDELTAGLREHLIENVFRGDTFNFEENLSTMVVLTFRDFVDPRPDIVRFYPSSGYVAFMYPHEYKGIDNYFKTGTEINYSLNVIKDNPVMARVLIAHEMGHFLNSGSHANKKPFGVMGFKAADRYDWAATQIIGRRQVGSEYAKGRVPERLLDSTRR